MIQERYKANSLINLQRFIGFIRRRAAGPPSGRSNSADDGVALMTCETVEDGSALAPHLPSPPVHTTVAPLGSITAVRGEFLLISS